MKTIKNTLAIFVVFVLILSGSLITCEVGLGRSVDTKPPTISIAYPPAVSIIRGSFIVSGKAEDETSLKRVDVSLKARTGVAAGSTVFTGTTVIDATTNTWKIEIPQPVSDGDYDVTATAVDGADRTSSVTRSYKIDNTPPVLVLQRPSTKSESDVSLLDPFGQEIKFSGNWWDSNGNDGCTLVINFFDKTGTEFLKSHTQNLPTQNWEIALGSGNPAWDALNSKIVGQAATPFAYTLSLSDDASEWKDPSKPNEPSNATGNVINHYYLYSDLTAKLTVGDKYPKLSDLSAVEQGRAISEVPSSISSALTSLQIPASPHVWDNTMGMFSFDPNDKNPSFEIDNLKIRANGGTVNPNDNSVSKYPVFNIKIKPNKDGDAIQQDSIKITYIPIKTDKTLDEANSVLTEGASLKKSTIGSIVNVNYSKNLEQGAFRLIIYAKDVANHEKTETYDVYINTGAPVLRSVSPDKSPQNTKVNSTGGKFTVVVKGTDGDDNVTLTVTNDTNNQVLTVDTDYTVNLVKNQNGYEYDYKWTLVFASEGDGTEKKLRFQLNDGQFDSSVMTVNFVVDDTLPELKSLTKPTAANSFPLVGSVLLSDQSVTVQGFADKDLEKALLLFVKESDPAPTIATPLNLWTEALVDNSPTGNEKGFMGQVPLLKGSDANEGKYTLYARFADDTYDAILNNYGPVYEILTVDYDKANPTFTETTSGISDTALEYKNSNINFGGESTDGNGIASVVVSYKKDGAAPVTLLNQTDGAATWSTSLETSLGDGSYELTFTATDNAGKTTKFTRNVMIDTASPLLAITSPSTGEGVSSDSYTIRGTVDDGSGKGVASIEYSLDSTDGTNGTWNTITKAASWNAGITLTGGEGLRTLWVRASDGLNLAAVKQVSFQYDKDPPILTEGTSGLDEALVNRKESVSFGGSASDSNALESVQVRLNGGTPADVTEPFASWTYTLSAPSDNSNDGTYKIEFIATDVAGRTKIITRNVTIDTTKPTIEITSNPGAYITNSLAVAGTAGDGSGSGVATTYYRIGGSTGDPATGTLTGSDNWFKTIDTSGLAEGTHRVYVWSVDRAGNKSAEVSQNFTIDRADPIIDSGSPSSQSTGVDVTISGTASDTHLTGGSITATYTKDGGSVKTTTVTGTLSNWSILVDVDAVGFGSGTYVYTIKATDSVGRSSEIIRTVVIDIDKPTVFVTNIDDDGSTLVNSNSFTVTGTASDTGLSGLKNVEYSLDSGSTWINATGTDNWLISLIGLTDTLTKSIQLRATDNASNVSPVVSRTFKVDLANPTFTEITSGISDTALVYKNTDISFGGASTDANGIASVAVSYKKDGAAPVPLLNQTDGAGTWSTSLQTSLGDGSYELTFIATDKVGKTTSFTRNVMIDTHAPILDITSPSAGEGVSSNSYTIRGTVDDGSGKGVTTLEYSVDNSNWLPITRAASWSVSGVNFSGVEGPRVLWVRASDGLNTTTAKSVSFQYDTDNPVLTETGINTIDTQYRKDNITLIGKLTDTNALAAGNALTLSINNATATGITVDGSGNWSNLFDVSSRADGTYTLVFTGTDIASRTASLTRTIVVDKTIPTISLTTDLSGWKTGQTLAVSGTTTDATSGVSTVEYSTDGTNFSPLSGTTNWTGSIPVVNGANSLRFRAIDRAGNTSSVITQSVNVDLANPELTITSPSALVRVNGANTLNVTANAKDIGGSGVASVLVKVGSLDFASPSATASLSSGTNNEGTWTASIPSTALNLADGSNHTVYVRATDTAGRTTDSTFNILIDKALPTVSISSPTDTTVNKTITLSGTAGDAQVLSSVVLEVQKADLSWATIQTFTGSSAYNWSQSAINTASYENTTYPSSGGKYQFILRATAIDEAGNTASATKTYIIDQNSDRPLIRLSNLKTDGSTTLINSTVVTGSLIDDDGTVSVGNFAVSEDGSTWITAVSGVGNPTNPLTLYYDETTRAFQYNPSSGDGSKKIYFKITDVASTTFTTPITYDAGQILSYPNIQYGTDTGTATGQSVSFKVDTNPPEIHSDIYFDASTPYTFDGPTALDATYRLINNTLFGGNRKIFALRISAKDAIGIASVSVKINGNTYGATKISGAVGSDEVFVTSDSTLIDVSGWASGSYDVEVSVTDTSGLISKTTRQISIDNTAPTVEITSHTENEQVTGDIIFRGTTDDGTGSGIQTVQYKVGNDTIWKSVDGTYSWRIEFTEAVANKITTTGTYANATHATNIGAGIWRLPITIRATDKIGNIKDTVLHLDIDPDGDKPKVSVLYPNNGSTLGGVIRIFGSAEDNVSVKAVWMMIDTDNNGDFNAADATFLGDKGYAVEGSGTDESPYQFKVSGTASWNMAINAAGEFNPSGSDPKSIRFRVRAQDNNDLYGNWSEVRTISVDNNAPQIGSTKPLKLVQFAGDGTTVIAEKDYVANMYIRGEWFLVGSVWDESGISTLNVTGSANRTLEGDASANPKWFVQDGLVAGTGKYNYQLRIPVGRPLTDTTAGLQSYTIFVEDASDPKGSATSNILLNYDNKSPTMTQIMRGGLVLNTTNIIEQSNRHFTLESDVTEVESGFERLVFYFVRKGNGTTTFDRIYNPMVEKGQPYNHTTLTTFTMSDGLPLYGLTGVNRTGEDNLQHNSIINNQNIRKGGLVRIAGVDRVISNVNYTTGLVEFSPGVSTTHSDVSFVIGQVVNNTTIETGNWTGDTLTSITNDDGDGMIESVERSGGTYHWTASINSKNIPDGPIELHYVAFDKAGNSVNGSVETFVSNNRPKLAKVYLGTDLDGNGSFTSNELVRYYNATSGEEESVVNLASQDFKIKGRFGIFTEFVGGNGDLGSIWTTNGASQDAWVSGYPSSAITGTTATLSDVNVGGSIGTLKGVVIEASSLTAMNDRVKLFSFTFWDQTEETTQGTNSQWALLNAPAKVDVIDTVSPVVAIRPFYWNSKIDNSLFENKKANGHIELEADLPALFDQPTGLFDRDPKVSGQISVRGTAYDDQRITSLWMNIDGFTFTGSDTNSNQFDTNADGTLENLGRTYYRLATYSGGNWTGTDQWTTNGWEFSVNDVSLSQEGHQISWQLDWDTSRITNVAATDRNIRILAVDRRGDRTNASSESAVNSPSDVTTNNRPFYRVDVVPYITSINTPNRTASGLKDNNIRSSDGKYSIIKGNTSTFTTITGFNLNPGTNDVRLVDSATVGLNNVSASSGTGLARNAATAPYTSLTVTNNSTRSGYLEVFTNGVRTLNNVNANTAKGDYTGSDELSMYNLEPDPYLRKNLLLNDDRYLRFFDMKTTGVKNAYYPEMIMEGDNPVFAYVNYAGGPGTAVGLGQGTGAGSYYPSHAMPQRAKFNGSTAAEMTTEYLIKASIWDQIGMARDEGGRYHHITVYNRDGGGMSYLYDRYAELYTNGMGWGTGTAYSGYTGNSSENANNNAITLETVNFGNGLLLGRYQYPKLIAKGNSIDGAAQIYALYYDDNTTNRDLIFRNFRVGSTVTGTGTATLYVGGTASTGQAYAQRSNLADENTSGRITAATSASRHFDYGVTSDNRVVIVYFDEIAGQLKLRYSNAGVDGSSPTTNPGWTTSSVTFPDYIGNYVSMTLDSANGIHIAAFDSSDSDLSYMYLPAYNSTNLSVVTVDAAFSVGNWTQIKVRESGGNRIPYIAYYNSSETGGRDSIKLAFCKTGVTASNVPSGVDANGNVTGNWECMTVPALTPPQGGSTMFKHVCLDFDSAGIPVLGYLGTNLEFGKWLGE